MSSFEAFTRRKWRSLRRRWRWRKPLALGRALRAGGAIASVLARREPAGAGRIQRPAFEYNLTEHCNLACHGCDHASPLLPEKFASLERFKADLGALGEVYHAKELRIVGGEPLLHRELVGFLEFARSSGIADRLVLITNGVLLHKAEARLFGLLDEVRLSVYPQVKLALELERYAEIVRARGAEFTPLFQDRFHRTLLNARNEDQEIVRAIYRACKLTGKWSCHAVHEGRYYKCSPAPFMSPRLARLGIALDDAGDGIPLHAPDLRGRLERYLEDTHPLASCSFCLGTSGPAEEHHLLNRKGVEAWWKEDHRGLIEGLRSRRLHPVAAARTRISPPAAADPCEE